MGDQELCHALMKGQLFRKCQLCRAKQFQSLMKIGMHFQFGLQGNRPAWGLCVSANKGSAKRAARCQFFDCSSATAVASVNP